MRVIDLTGQVVGMLTVLRRAGTKNTFATWHVWCACGVEKVISGHELRGKRATQSCGCTTQARRLAHVITHGMTGSITYASWIAMRGRCNDPADPTYDRYGGRGIRVCKRWDESFEAFLEDMGERPSKDVSIDRRDVNGNYEKTNCRWATRKEQCRNRRSNRRVTFAGECLTVTEWAERTGIRKGTLRQRLDRGWSVHDALSVAANSTLPLVYRKSA